MNDIIGEIFEYLDMDDMIMLSGVNIKFYDLCAIQSEKRLKKIFDIEFLKCMYKLTYISAYIKWIEIKKFLNISKLKHRITEIYGLTSINLPNFFTSFKNLGTLINLKKITAQYTDFSSLTDSFTKLTNLEILYMSNSPKGDPEIIYSLASLTKLQLENNWMDYISNSISKLVNLKTVSFNNNSIKQIPDAISHLTNLTNISFDCNELTHVTHAITTLTNLKFIYLAQNKIIIFPSSLTNLTNLRTLNLRDAFKEPQTIAYPENLKNLCLSINKIPTLVPTTIFKSLSNIELVDNKIQTFPSILLEYTNLHVLNLGNNNIRSIPDELNKLKNLKKLFLAHNKIMTIPKSFEDLRELIEFDISNNQISIIPIEVINLQIKKFNYQGNLIRYNIRF